MAVDKSLKKTYKDFNKMLFDGLSEHVIGHDYAKKVLINTVNKSRLRAVQKKEGVPKEEWIGLNNCLLIGDSGTGKTYLVESLLKIVDIPLVKIDATMLSPTGAGGGIKNTDLEEKILKTARDFDNRYYSNISAIDSVIVFVDEVDKLAQHLSSDWNEHVQANFLKTFENGNDIANVTYIFAGAFTGLEKYESSKPRKSYGFVHHDGHEIEEEGDLADKIVKYGLIPELVGRMSHIVLLDQLKAEQYRSILRTKLIPKAKKHMEIFGIENFKLPKDREDEIVERSVKSGLGVRALQSAVDRLLVEYEFNPTSYGKKKA